MCVCIVCPAPLWVGGACLYVHACIGVCMYLSVSMYVCMYSLCVCMYTCNACCEASTQTNLLLLSLLLGGPNPFGGGGHEPGTRDHIYMLNTCSSKNSSAAHDPFPRFALVQGPWRAPLHEAFVDTFAPPGMPPRTSSTCISYIDRRESDMIQHDMI